MINSVLKELRHRMLDDIHSKIWLTTLSNCATEAEKAPAQNQMK